MARSGGVGGRSDGLEIDDDPRFQHRSWTAERIGWAVIALLLVAAGLGLCGSSGPLNQATAEDAEGTLRVEYARFARHGAPTEVQVEVGAAATAVDTLRVAISRAYLAAVEIAWMQPEPETVELTGEAFVYVFPVAERGQPLAISFEVEPQRYWRQRARVWLPEGGAVSITQFVYP